MAKDKRYKTVKHLIESGHIHEFREIFDTIPKTVVAEDMGTNYKRLLRLVENVDQFKVGELYSLAGMFDVDRLAIMKLVIKQSENKLGTKKKR